MTPAKRRPATPASEGPTREATEDSTELLGPDGAPVAQEAPAGDAGEDSARPESGQVDPEDPATTPAPARARPHYPLPVWPD